MQTSTSTTAISLWSRHSSASLAELACQQVLAELAQNGLVREELRRLVVDQQNIDPIDACRPSAVDRVSLAV